jgi:hypothetical protein
MNKAHDLAHLFQAPSFVFDAALALHGAVERITTTKLRIHSRIAWPEMNDAPIQCPAQALYEAGLALYERGEFEKAVAQFQAALQMEWRHEGALKWIAIAERAASERAATASCPSALGLSGLKQRTVVPSASGAE